MRRRLTDRVDRFGALGQAGLELLRAEAALLQSELGGGARRLGGIVLLFAVALFVLFWALGALVLSLVEAAALWLPRWGAALAVVGLLLLAAAVLVAIARRRLARLESPAATVRRRAEEYQEWWERRVVGGGGGGAAGPAGARDEAVATPEDGPSPRAGA